MASPCWRMLCVYVPMSAPYKHKLVLSSIRYACLLEMHRCLTCEGHINFLQRCVHGFSILSISQDQHGMFMFAFLHAFDLLVSMQRFSDFFFGDTDFSKERNYGKPMLVCVCTPPFACFFHVRGLGGVQPEHAFFMLRHSFLPPFAWFFMFAADRPVWGDLQHVISMLTLSFRTICMVFHVRGWPAGFRGPPACHLHAKRFLFVWQCQQSSSIIVFLPIWLANADINGLRTQQKGHPKSYGVCRNYIWLLHITSWAVSL